MGRATSGPGAVPPDRLELLIPTELRKWVRWGAWLTLLGYGVSLATGLALMPGSIGSRVGEVGVVLLAAAALRIGGSGRLRLAGGLLVGGVWLELHLSLVWDGVAGAPGLAALPLVVMAAALFSGRRVGWIFALSTVVSLPAVTWLYHLHSRTPGLGSPMEIGTWVLLPLACITTAALIGLALESIGRSVLAAQESEGLYARLVGRVPDALLSVDPRDHVRVSNSAAVRLLGSDAEVGSDLASVRTGTGESLATVLDTMEPGVPLQVSLLLPDRIQRVELRSEATEGESDRIVLLRDVSDVAALEERLTQIGGLIEDARQELYVFTLDTGHLRLVSRGARAALGYVEGERGPRTIEEVNPSLAPTAVAVVLDEAAGREVPPFRTLHHRADGSVYPVEVRLQRSRLDGAEVVVCFASDVRHQLEAEAEQEALRRQLEHAQRMEAIGHLAGGIAHDFNNLLAVMGGCAEALADDVPEESRELVETLLEAQDRGAALTRRLLSFARKDVVESELIDMAALVEGIRGFAERLVVAPGGLDLEVHGPLPIVIDAGRLEQVLLNLVANARDADPTGGAPVRVRAFARGDEVVLEVEDEGVGMDAATVQRVFDPYFTTKPRGKGTGLGLATVHTIVEQAGGRTEIDSAPGEGTTVRVVLPRAQGEVPVLAEPPTTDLRLRVLYAEDDEDGRRLVTRMLERAGHEVTAVADGESALARVGDGSEWDIVITDVVMGGVSGIEVADRIATCAPGLPVLLVSGYLDEHLPRASGLGEGRDLLLKPFRGDQLLRRVRHLYGDTAATRQRLRAG